MVTRKRNLGVVREREEELEEDQEREAATKRVRSKFDKPLEVPAVKAWQEHFAVEKDRYPFLVLLGPSRSRKTEFAKSTDRFNYCWGAFNNMWRKKSEGNWEPLAGKDDYQKQVPLKRALPIWGGISEDGFEPVLWHPTKKTNNQEWSAAVREGKLSTALRKLNPRQRSGSWTVLCDGESFLRHTSCMKAYAIKRIELWQVPASSPDLNPIEMFWGWVMRQLRLKDLADLRMKRPPLGKTAYIQRVKTLFRSAKAQGVAKNLARRFRKTCKEVLEKKGGAART